jgi:hypothetical protein
VGAKSGDELAARRSVQKVQANAERQAASDELRPAPPAFGAARPAVAPTAAAAVRPPTRYCPA